jgi:seryl-tRNA synthetase
VITKRELAEERDKWKAIAARCKCVDWATQCEYLRREKEELEKELKAEASAHNGAIYDRDRARKNVDKLALEVEELRHALQEERNKVARLILTHPELKIEVENE